MKILSLASEKGKLVPIKELYDHCDFFKKLEEWGHSFISKPTADPYYIFLRISHGNPWAQDTTPESQILFDQIRKDLQSKHAVLVILNVESFGVIKSVLNGNSCPPLWVQYNASFFDIPASNIIYSDAGFSIEQGMKSKGIKAIWLDWFQNYIIPDPFISSSARQSILDKSPRSKKFIYFGGTSANRPHRLEFITKAIAQCGFKENAYYSNAPGSYYDSSKNALVNVPGKVLDLPEIDDKRRRISNLIGKTLFPAFHADSYVNIIANSYFSYDPGRLELNEKVHKPMHCMQPFINLGEVGTLKALKSLGYKTFDKWFDESYDQLIDEQERMEAVLSEVTRIGNMSNDELNDMLVDMLPVLEHNCALVTERYYSDQGFRDFVAKLEAYRNLIISG